MPQPTAANYLAMLRDDPDDRAAAQGLRACVEDALAAAGGGNE